MSIVFNFKILIKNCTTFFTEEFCLNLFKKMEVTMDRIPSRMRDTLSHIVDKPMEDMSVVVYPN